MDKKRGEREISKGAEIKRVYILRHSKSSWADQRLLDYQRPLKKRGKKDAKLVANYLKNGSVKIDKIISSGAKRAYQTAKIISKELSVDIEKTDELYSCSIYNILSIIQDSSDKFESIMVVSHNLTVSEFVYKFIPDNRFEWIPTTGLVGLEFEVDSFGEIDFSLSPKLLLFITPKELR